MRKLILTELSWLGGCSISWKLLPNADRLAVSKTVLLTHQKARLQLLATGLLILSKLNYAYLIFIFLPFDFTFLPVGTVTVPGAGAVVVVDSIVVDDGVVSVVVPLMGEVVVVDGVVVVLRVVVVVVPVWALAE